MIRHIFFVLSCTLLSISALAQTNAGLVRYFTFDQCDGRDNGTAGIDAIVQNGPQCACGVSGNGLEFDGIDDAMIIPGTANLMNTIDFTISFYYKSTAGASQDLLSRKEFCDNDHAFAIRVIPGSNTIVTQMRENNGKGTLFNNTLDQSNCWHHVVFVRKDDFHTLYLDGVLVEEKNTVSRVDISNENIQLEISGGPCLGIQDLPFRGIIDELRIYNRALTDNEVEGLAVSIDEIVTQDTLIFLGSTVDVFSSESCADSYIWSPSQGVSDVTSPDVALTPEKTTVYSLAYSQGACTSRDSFRISVIDPEQLDCEQLFMANAFTPNGDGNNDSYGISNPFALEEFTSFEILDKWGDKVYFTNDKFAKWNGTYKGANLTGGVYLFRVFYKCAGVEQVRTGSVTMIR